MSKQNQVEAIKAAFSERGFRFSEGTMASEPRTFGVAKGCTLELVGSEQVSLATMVAVMARDDLDIARQNGVRLVALMALVAGPHAAQWMASALRRTAEVRATVARTETEISGFKLRFVANREKSTVTVKASRIVAANKASLPSLA